MIATIFAFFKTIVEFLKLGKWFYQETQKTEIEQDNEIDKKISEEKDKAKKGRPTWEK